MKNNSTAHSVHGGKMIVLALLGVSLLAILVTSFVYRTMHPHITEVVREQPPAQMPQNGAQQGASTEELAHLMALMQEDPNNPDVLKQISDLFIRTKDWERALFFLQKAMVATPSDPQILYMHGIVLFNQDKPEEAAAAFESLLAIEDDASARYNLGIIYKHFLKQPEKAQEHFSALLANDNAEPELKQRAQQELETEHK
ncbi:tetratricopeptide repeat protein [Desulfovibrio psychrotolerans]|uniref:Tetratricopeptide repeat protein n=1 Tax=Desulfovibrio psychrotolerans TaxID=415242 RepID=A0A7J0BRH1_9BACT|nr:tetratricopeptide repeat protein [Desulfovibrio psychrotolerans]GFM35782.1 hypothetical protein DSM19430T_04660 [Desulfovibrio psychrotolerans]